MYEYAGTIKVPERSHDLLANITVERFNEAVRWQSQEQVGGKSLRTVLRDCYDQFNGILSCEDQAVVDELGVDATVNLTAMKSGLVQSYLLETLVQGNAIPWVIHPTPIPDLSAQGKSIALDRVREKLFSQQFSGDVGALIAQIKTTVMTEEYEEAKGRAENMEKLITDQCLQGGWNSSMYSFTTDFTVYPYAILQGPVPVRRPELQWTDDKLQVKYSNSYEFRSISPWDFWYSPDSPDTQRGTGIYTRQRWNRQTLLQAAQMKSYFRDSIIKVLEDIEKDSEFNFAWMAENPDQYDNNLRAWTHASATIDVMTHHGFFSGRELSTYGMTGLENLEFYNASVTIVNGRTVQVVMPRNPNLNLRPIHTSSFYKTRDRIPSFSIPQRIRDVERCFATSLRYLMSNAANSSGPIVEADYTRLSKYMSDDDIGRLLPNTMYMADSEMVANNPAMRFYSIPSVMGQYLQLQQYFMDLVDRVSNIPAALHGTAQGSGANRTFRGAAMLQGNAIKAIQAAVANIDQFVFEPIGQMLYNYNMLYEDDESIKGDCKIMAQGATGLLQREVDRQNSYEILQLVASAGNQLAQVPNGAQIVTWAMSNVFNQMGVPKDLVVGMTMTNQSGIPGAAGETGLTSTPIGQESAPAQITEQQTM